MTAPPTVMLWPGKSSKRGMHVSKYSIWRGWGGVRSIPLGSRGTPLTQLILNVIKRGPPTVMLWPEPRQISTQRHQKGTKSALSPQNVVQLGGATDDGAADSDVVAWNGTNWVGKSSTTYCYSKCHSTRHASGVRSSYIYINILYINYFSPPRVYHRWWRRGTQTQLHQKGHAHSVYE